MIGEPDEAGASGSDPVMRASVKAPAFMDTAVEGWFAIMDAQFHLAHITQTQSKFYHVLAVLPPDTVSRLGPDVLSNKTFEGLKEAVTSLYAQSKPELFERLISRTQMTGRPSAFLHELRDTASKVGVGEELVRHKMIKSLPPSVGAVLAAQRDLTLTQLGQLADELVPLMQASCMVAQPHSDRQPRGRSPSPSEQYRPSRASRYSEEMNHGQRSFRSESRYRARHYSPFPERQDDEPMGLRPYREGQRPKVCRAHIYFGKETKTCKPWCQWPDKMDAQTPPSSRSSSPRSSRAGN